MQNTYYSYRYHSWMQLRCTKCNRFLSKGQHKHKMKLCSKCSITRRKIYHKEYSKQWNKIHHVLTRPYRVLNP